MMNIEEFRNSINKGLLPQGLPLYVQALWYDARGDWKTAHDLIDQLTDLRSAKVHAYLHRKEGDSWNADYWYSKSKSKRPNQSLEAEWADLVQELLYFS